MKEMQKAMYEMSPEDKKAMDSMGIKMTDMKSIQKNVAGITDAQLKKLTKMKTGSYLRKIWPGLMLHWQ